MAAWALAEESPPTDVTSFGASARGACLPSKGRRSRPWLLGTLLATVAAAPVALAMQALQGTDSSPKTMGRVLVHIVLLAGVSGSGAQLVNPMADSSESATDASAGPPPPPSVDLDAFYSADVEKVAAFLGPEMHFHHGLASPRVSHLAPHSRPSSPSRLFAPRMHC